jgi:hypothetical protein
VVTGSKQTNADNIYNADVKIADISGTRGRNI